MAASMVLGHTLRLRNLKNVFLLLKRQHETRFLQLSVYSSLGSFRRPMSPCRREWLRLFQLEDNRSRRIFSETQSMVKTKDHIGYRQYSTERSCWKCGKKTPSSTELFFCDCGIVQTPADDLDYFSLLGFDVDFDIDTAKLSKEYKDLQRKLHPDKFSLNSEEERRLADQQSSLVNKAYFTLLKPLSRGLYMLNQHGYPIEESSGDVDPEFLMEIMEKNEQLDEADSREEVKDLEQEIRELITETISDISDAFKKKDLPEAKRLIVKYQYYGNIEDKIKEWHRSHMN